MSPETRAHLFILLIWAGLGAAFLGLLLKAFGIPGGPESRLYRTGDLLHVSAARMMIAVSVIAFMMAGR